MLFQHRTFSRMVTRLAAGTAALLTASALSIAQPKISYIIPDIGAPGMNTYVEIIGPHEAMGNFGVDSLYLNNPGDAVRVLCERDADTNTIVIGPIVVSWSGRMISTQVFVRPDVVPNSAGWNALNPRFRIPLVVEVGGTRSSADTFYAVIPQPAISVNAPGTLGSGGLWGLRSRRGAMILDGLLLGGNGVVDVATTDCDPVNFGEQGFLPATIISKGMIRIASTVSVSVNAPGGQNPDAGAGGGGGGSESWTNGASQKGNPAGAGYTGGGSEIFLPKDGPGAGSGGVRGLRLGDGGMSLNGAPGGSGEYVANMDTAGGGGGTGHPFGTGGGFGATEGGYGGGSGLGVRGGGGFGGAGFAAHASGGPSTNTDGKAHGNLELVPMAGGSGGGSGSEPIGIGRGGGGGGGGALSLHSGKELVASGGIQSMGADGLGGSGHPGWIGAGGGSGGGIALSAKLPSTLTQIDVSGGIGAVGGGSKGGDGSAGRVRFDMPLLSAPAITPSPSIFGSSLAEGPSIDTSSFISPTSPVRGAGDGHDVRLFLRSAFGDWFDFATLTGYPSTGWSQIVNPSVPSPYYFLVAAQKVATQGTPPFQSEPDWILSQAAANILRTPTAPTPFRSTLHLPDICSGALRIVPVVVQNDSTSDLIQSVVFAGPTSADYRLIDSLPVSFVGGRPTRLTLAFAPLHAGIRSDVMILQLLSGRQVEYWLEATVTGSLASILQPEPVHLAVGQVAHDTCVQLRNTSDVLGYFNTAYWRLGGAGYSLSLPRLPFYIGADSTLSLCFHVAAGLPGAPDTLVLAGTRIDCGGSACFVCTVACDGSRMSKVDGIFAGIPAMATNLSIHPNPASGIASIQVRGFCGDVGAEARVVILDQLGRTLCTKRAAINGSGECSTAVPPLPNGSYLCLVSVARSQLRCEFVVVQ